jgi:hypothetical protein
MSSYGVFDPLDLEIIDRVYEAAWARIDASSHGEMDETKDALRRWVMTCASPGNVDFDSLYEQVCASLPNGWLGRH